MKKFGRRLIAGLCSAAIAASMFTMASASSATTLNSFEAVSENVKLIGRSYRGDDTTYFNYTASGVEFTCTGSMVRFKVRQAGDPTRIAIYVNDALYSVGMLRVGSNTGVIDVALEEGENTVKLIKLSESANSTLAIDSIETDGEAIAPTAAKTHSIEFIGDSITCGYGADGASNEAFSTSNENGAKTYAYLTAQNFNADYSMVSVSGAGIISGYTGTQGVKNETLVVPTFYENLCYTWSYIDGANVGNYEWDFSQYQPELVVINLGTNDNSYTGSDATRRAEYEEGYVEFLKVVRENNPDATILCTLGIMGQQLYDSMANAVETYKTETGDSNIYTYEFAVQDTTNNGTAPDWHPSEASHSDAAVELTAQIEAIMGWETVTPTETGMAGYSKDDDAVFDVVAEEEPEDSSVADSEADSSVTDSEADSSVADSEADSTSDASSDTGSTDSSEVSSEESVPSTESPATDNNPSTGAVAGTAAVAVLLSAALVTVKRKK